MNQRSTGDPTLPRARRRWAAGLLAVAFVVALASCGSDDSDNGSTASSGTVPPLTATSRMTPDQVIPGPGAPVGQGLATFTTWSDHMCVDLTVAGIDLAGVAAELREGIKGALGPLLLTLPTPGADGKSSGCFQYADSPGAAKFGTTPSVGNHYVQVRNAAYPAGAMRGQIA